LCKAGERSKLRLGTCFFVFLPRRVLGENFLTYLLLLSLIYMSNCDGDLLPCCLDSWRVNASKLQKACRAHSFGIEVTLSWLVSSVATLVWAFFLFDAREKSFRSLNLCASEFRHVVLRLLSR
jgi:hypothetical protein